MVAVYTPYDELKGTESSTSPQQIIVPSLNLMYVPLVFSPRSMMPEPASSHSEVMMMPELS